jgi:hypothetical protein
LREEVQPPFRSQYSTSPLDIHNLVHLPHVMIVVR